MKMKAVNPVKKFFIKIFYCNPKPGIRGTWIVEICRGLRIARVYPYAAFNTLLKDKFFVFFPLVKRIEYYARRVPNQFFHLFFGVCGCCNYNFLAKLFVAKPRFVRRACTHAIQISFNQGEC